MVGFCDHERDDLLLAARSRGVRAVAKGRFASELKHLLTDASDGQTEP